jgi:hypothetical protein
MTTRRELLIALGAIGCALPYLPCARQPPTKIYRIGFLGGTSAKGWARNLEALYSYAPTG